MLVFLPFVAYLVVASVSLYILACLLYRHDPYSPERCVAAVVTFSVGAVSLAVASLVWMEIRLATNTTAQAPAPAYAESVEGDSGAEQ